MSIDMGLTDVDSVGGRVIVPTSFTGGRRHHVMNYRNVMAICRVYGPPDLFVTFRCDTKWREIRYVLSFEPGWQPCYHSAQAMCVSHRKVDEFIAGIREGITFDHVLAVMVEFQKCGLPHIHSLVWLASSISMFSASAVDSFICVDGTYQWNNKETFSDGDTRDDGDGCDLCGWCYFKSSFSRGMIHSANIDRNLNPWQSKIPNHRMMKITLLLPLPVAASYICVYSSPD